MIKKTQVKSNKPRKKIVLPGLTPLRKRKKKRLPDPRFLLPKSRKK